MLRTMHRITLIGAALLAGCAARGPDTATTSSTEPADERLAPVAFLRGAWVTEWRGGRRTEEHWIHPAGGTMLGVNRTLSRGADGSERTAFFEFLMIVVRPGGEIDYLAAPAGRSPPTPFRLTASGPGELVFENPEHDFPQRIIYRRTGEGGLVARIEGTRAGQARTEEWLLSPASRP